MTTESPVRVLHLPSGQNFRDVGSYTTRDGRRARWRHVFRSGYMSDITGEDAAQIHALGIDTIVDLRSNEERADRPTRWHEGTETQLWTRDHGFSVGAIGELAGRQDLKPEHSRETMLDAYRKLPHEQIDSYRELFTRLATGRVPILFNCSAGKDRTGLASALLMKLLGASEEAIVEDYMLSNAAIDGLITYMTETPKYQGLIKRMDCALPMLRVEPEYLAKSLSTIETEHGSVERYFDEAMGIDPDMQAAIRENLLD